MNKYTLSKCPGDICPGGFPQSINVRNFALTTTINMFQVHNSFRFGNKEMKDDKKCEGSIETPKECVKSVQT